MYRYVIELLIHISLVLRYTAAFLWRRNNDRLLFNLREKCQQISFPDFFNTQRCISETHPSPLLDGPTASPSSTGTCPSFHFPSPLRAPKDVVIPCPCAASSPSAAALPGGGPPRVAEVLRYVLEVGLRERDVAEVSAVSLPSSASTTSGTFDMAADSSPNRKASLCAATLAAEFSRALLCQGQVSSYGPPNVMGERTVELTR